MSDITHGRGREHGRFYAGRACVDLVGCDVVPMLKHPHQQTGKGELRLRTKVHEIMVNEEGGKAVGVKLADGTIIKVGNPTPSQPQDMPGLNHAPSPTAP